MFINFELSIGVSIYSIQIWIYFVRKQDIDDDWRVQFQKVPIVKLKTGQK